MTKAQKFSITKFLIFLIIILLCFWGIRQCQLAAMQKALGPDPFKDPRSLEVMTLFAEAAAQNKPIPLSSIMRGGINAYVAYIPPYSPMLGSNCNMFNSDFILNLGVEMTSDYICKLVVFDETGVVDEAIFRIPDLSWKDTGGAKDYKLCTKLNEVYLINKNTLVTKRYLYKIINRFRTVWRGMGLTDPELYPA